MSNPKIPLKNPRALVWLVLLGAGLWLGQHLFGEAFMAWPSLGEPPWIGVAASLVAVATLLLARQEGDEVLLMENGPVRRSLRVLAWLEPFLVHWREVVLGLTAALGIFVLWQIPRLILPNDSFVGVSVLWALSCGLYLTAVAPSFDLTNWQAWLKRSQGLILLVCGILLCALFLRVWHIESLPFTLSGDESAQGLEAIRVLKGNLTNPFATGWLGVPTMSFFFNSLSIHWLGQTIFALRLPWAFVGTITVLFTFLLVQQLKGTRMALVTAVLLAVYHYHIHYSRLGSNQVADPLFLAASLYFLYRGLDQDQLFDWALAGSIAGLAFYFYAGARLTVIVLLAVLAYDFLGAPRTFWRKRGWGVLTAVGGFLVFAGPMIQYAIRFPSEFNARLNVVGIIQSGWLEREVVIRGQSTAAILFDQFCRAFLAFNYYPDRTVWYGLREPLLNPIWGMMFLVGLLYSTLRLVGPGHDKRLAPMVAWWWGGMILGGMLTESPPSSQRLITLAVPVCFFLCLTLWELVHLLRKTFWGVSVDFWLGIGVLAFATYSITLYFSDYTPRHIYGGPHAELATTIAPELNELKKDHRIVFVGAPIMYWGFATLPYLVPQADAGDVIEPLTTIDTLDYLSPNKGVVFIVLPERLGELNAIRAAFPKGQEESIHSSADDRTMAVLYVVDP